MAATNYTGFQITSWGSSGDATHQLVSTGVLPEANFTLDNPADSPEYFPQSSSGPYSVLAGMASWTFQYQGQLKTPSLGIEAGSSTVVFANGSVFNLDQWNLNITVEALEVTDASATNGYKLFIPGGFRWSGTWGGFLDSSTNLADSGATQGSLPASATFRYGAQAAHTLAGSVNAGYSLAVAAGQPNRYTGTFVGSGDLTGGSIASGVVLSAAFAIPSTETIVASGIGQVLSGSAFPNSIGINWAASNFTSVSVAGQGTGILNKTS
ncbi:MAG: hypothetical protein B7733_13095 [Myxococcales bacterium FL481]|nr:MAG: hypothetical protein B7733_13095 [Myxococcales bacterium FL481]